jgi:hypothetical protein
MPKIPLDQLINEFAGCRGVLLVGLGFDQRCLAVLSSFPRNDLLEVIGVSNAGWMSQGRHNIEKFRALTNPECAVVGQDAKGVIDVADELSRRLGPFVADPSIELLIDITSLSHELLVLVLGMLNQLGGLNRTTLLYVGAAAYSTNTEPGEMWLSRGVKDVRSVLGFPGNMLPSRRLHLTILTGFEVERAAEVILRYEPSSLSIGLGAKGQSVSEAHHNKNQEFFDRIAAFASSQDYGTDDVARFSFSCISPTETRDQLIEHISSLEGFKQRNLVVCPLNTKLSTVGVVLAAIEYPDIQICYAEPEQYNTEGYSSPGTDVTIVKLHRERTSN